MGFHSKLCEGCEHPMLSSHATGKRNAWMSDVVAVTSTGNVINGEYDGYGGIGTVDFFDGGLDNATVYHRACHEIAGKPMAYTGDSAHAEDQGFFFDEPQHDLPDPRTVSAIAFAGAKSDAERYDPSNPPAECAECGDECDGLEAWQDEFDVALCESCAMYRQEDAEEDAEIA